MTNNGPAASPAPIASPMIAAVERAWADIREHHAELPEVVIVMGTGTAAGSRGIKIGSFSADRWAHREHDTANALDVGPAAAMRFAELLVSGEGLARQPHEIMATLLAQAALALGHVRGIKTTTRQGRWHNREFAKLAGETGVGVEPVRDRGYVVTEIPAETVARYMGTIMELELALTHVRLADVPVTVPTSAPVPAGTVGDLAVAAAPVRKRPGATCGCESPREVHIARKDLAAAPILCGVCLTAFEYDR